MSQTISTTAIRSKWMSEDLTSATLIVRQTEHSYSSVVAPNDQPDMAVVPPNAAAPLNWKIYANLFHAHPCNTQR
jgi:hypothetical protein